MGLQEKRLAKDIQENALPAFMAEVKSVAGFEPELNIDWHTFTVYDEYPLSRLEGDILPGMIEVFKSICREIWGKRRCNLR